MQTMPSKTRTSMLIGGIAALVLVVGVAIFVVGQRAQNEVGEPNDSLVNVAEPENGNALGTSPAATSPTTNTPANNTASSTDSTTAAPATNAAADENTAVGTPDDSAAPALVTLGAVPSVHVVQPDETLYDISMKYYKTHIYAGDIESLNGLEDPDQIEAGMELKLPQPAELAGVGQ